MLIFVEGVDKTGKDTLVRYINELTNYKHCVLTRGPLSTTAYAYKFNRKDYDDSYIKNLKDSLIVYLTADTEDLDIRFKLTNEPEIDKDKDKKLFNVVSSALVKKYGLNIITLNTTYDTPYVCAQKIKTYINLKEELYDKNKQCGSSKSKNGH